MMIFISRLGYSSANARGPNVVATRISAKMLEIAFFRDLFMPCTLLIVHFTCIIIREHAGASATEYTGLARRSTCRPYRDRRLVPLHSDYDSLVLGSWTVAGSGEARPILARAFS